MAFENRLQKPNNGMSKGDENHGARAFLSTDSDCFHDFVDITALTLAFFLFCIAVVFLSICLLIVTVITVMEHRKQLDIPSIATAEVKQQVAEITRSFESDLKRVEAASLAQVTAVQQEINQALAERNNIQDQNQAELESLKAQLEALTHEVEKVPQPFAIHEETPLDLVYNVVEIHGVKFEFAVRKQEHLVDLHSHIKREINGYAILKDAIEQSTQQPPLVMDVGANHGLVFLVCCQAWC